MRVSRSFLIGSALAICFAAAGLHTADAQEGSCHGGFPERFLGHCFRVNKRSFEKKDWLSAKRDCESIFSESHILTDMTQEIHDALGTEFSDIDSFWLGLNDRGTEGDFYWGNPENTPLGTPVQWDPNSSNDDSKDCVAMTRSSGYKWVPTDCSTRLAFICAQDVNGCTANPCHEFADCTNTDGSYTCTCRDGYMGDGKNCTGRCGQPCGENGECRNTGTIYECVCNDGFEGDGLNCTDHDECNDADHGEDHCHSEHGVCINSVGSFDCICKPGYMRTDGGLDKCVDVDECQSDKFVIPCPGHGSCENTVGGYKCNCEAGHRFKDRTDGCVDIDECAEGNHTCPADSTCVNTDGAYTCSCEQEGFVVQGSTCVDLDECQQTPSPCHANADCTNTPGAYTCACRDGFQGDGKTCTDIDECGRTPSPCHNLATCVNLAGSFQCNCPAGFQGDGTTSCADENECLATPSRCPANTDCTNNVGSFSCQCKTGFTGSPENCIDTDECAASPSPCRAPSSCRNTQGTYACVCSSGYQYQDSGEACVDIDECSASPRPCHEQATCQNTAGSYTCTCNSGYSGDGTQCTNDPNTNCVTDASGVTTCTCKPGFSGDGYTCSDINECANSPQACATNAQCTNTVGSYTCTCTPPYKGDGRACIDASNANCVTNSAGEEVCSCKPGFTGIGFTCSDINECAETPRRCHQQAACTNTAGSFRCTCNQGYQGDGIICRSSASVACTGSNLSKQRYQIVLDNVTLTQGLQDRTSVEYRTKIAEIESLLEPIIRRTKHGGKFQSVVVQELKIVQNEVVAVYDVCLENVNTVHGLDIQNEIRGANSVSNALGVNLQTVCFVDSNNAAECPTSQEVRQGGQSGLSSATALALGIALAALCLLLLIAICCWTRRHSKSYGENQSVGSAPSVYASTYHPPPSLYRTREHLYPTPSGPTVWPTVTSESIPSTFPPGSSYY